nr:AlNc14C5G735 [Albugo laibachii Nc14]|eukprot:CCA14677.1 AlNc14C5G735 [Albugo laibachii Nc14]
MQVVMPKTTVLASTIIGPERYRGSTLRIKHEINRNGTAKQSVTLTQNGSSEEFNGDRSNETEEISWPSMYKEQHRVKVCQNNSYVVYEQRIHTLKQVAGANIPAGDFIEQSQEEEPIATGCNVMIKNQSKERYSRCSYLLVFSP